MFSSLVFGRGLIGDIAASALAYTEPPRQDVLCCFRPTKTRCCCILSRAHNWTANLPCAEIIFNFISITLLSNLIFTVVGKIDPTASYSMVDTTDDMVDYLAINSSYNPSPPPDARGWGATISIGERLRDTSSRNFRRSLDSIACTRARSRGSWMGLECACSYIP